MTTARWVPMNWRIGINIQPPIWRARWMMLLYMLLIAIVAWVWRKWYMKRQQRRLDAEILLRETEKYSWMAEMRRKMAEEGINIPEHQVVEQQQVELNLKTSDDLVAYIKKICHDFKSSWIICRISCRLGLLSIQLRSPV